MGGPIDDTSSSDEKGPLVRLDGAPVLQNGEANHTAEQQLVALEEPAANVGVNRGCRVIYQVGQPNFDVVVFLAVQYASREQGLEVIQRVLVHWVDVRQISDDEVNDRTPSCGAPVLLSRLANVLVRDFALLHSLLNDVTSDL